MDSRKFVLFCAIMCVMFIVAAGILIYYPYDSDKSSRVEVFNYTFQNIKMINMSNSSITVDIPPQSPTWMAVVKEIDYNLREKSNGYTWDVNYHVDITENGKVRKSFKNITTDKMITVLTYYNKNYALDKIDAGMAHMVRENGIVHFVQYRNYTEYMSDVWKYQYKPTTKYDTKEFAPEYTPEPTPLPTFNADKWYEESLK